MGCEHFAHSLTRNSSCSIALNLHIMATEHHEGYRCDLILEPSQYSTVPPPMEGKAKVSVKLQPEVFNPFTLSPLPEQTIRDVLVDWVRNKLLLSPAAARGMVITGVTHDVAYCYKLETFTEHRSVCLRFEPHCKASKAPVSPKPAGEVQEPRPWKVPVTPTKMFHNQVLNYRLIHTDRVTGCSYCQELKWVMCKACCASTRVRCPVCHGRGRGTKKPCRECKGEKMVPCMSCMSLGRVCCEMCVGKGQLCYFKELRVDYRCHVDRYLLGVPGGIPEENISHAIGEILHTGLGQNVCPISTFSVEEVNAASRRMVRASHSSWPQCRIIQQRHLLRAVQVTRVQYHWRDTSGSVFIYGVDHSIYWPDYPERWIRLWCPCL